MSKLTVAVTNKRNSRGQYILIVYDSADKWLDEDPSAPAKVVKQLVSDGDTIETELPDATYGFLVLHDENQNDQMDRGVLLPKEGLAVSNDAKMTLKGPKWKDAKFDLGGDRRMQVRLKYWA